MTGWEVASDSVKIGLPLLLGGALTLFTLRVSRRHAERVDRRKRSRETLEGFTRALCRWHDALKDHYLFRRDQYFKGVDPILPWLEGNLETLNRSERYHADVEEFRALLLVHTELAHTEFGFIGQLGNLYAAHNAVTRAFAEPGKTEHEIAALESKVTEVYNGLLQTIRAAYLTV